MGHHKRLRGRQGVSEQDNSLLAAAFLCWVFGYSFQGMELCSVVGAQITSWDGEGKSGSIGVMDHSFRS